MSEAVKTVTKFERKRFSVPEADVSVLEWLALQSNPSVSIRQLIKESIQRDGMVDITCAAVSQLPRRGRPPKSLDEDEQVVFQDDISEPIQMTHTTPVALRYPKHKTATDEDGFISDPASLF